MEDQDRKERGGHEKKVEREREEKRGEEAGERTRLW